MQTLPWGLQMVITFLAIDAALMMWNFAIGQRAHYGKYPPVYIITKALFLPILAAIWYMISPDRSIYIMIYLLLAWIGDIFLFARNYMVYSIGGASFAFSHVAMTFYFNIKWQSVPYYAYFLMAPPFLFHFLYLIPKFDFRKLRDIFLCYYVVHLEMGAISAVARLSQFSFSNPSFLMCWVGYLFFITSDAFLILNELEVDKTPRRIGVMLTYVIAQVLILTGTAFSQGSPNLISKPA